MNTTQINTDRVNISPMLRRKLLILTILLTFLLGIAISTKSFSQEMNNAEPPAKQHKYYINLGLSGGNAAQFFLPLFRIEELSFNFTSYLASGVVAELGANARFWQGGGGHVILGYEVLNHQGWHIFPYLQASLNERGLAFQDTVRPSLSIGAGLGVDYEIPNSRLLIGLRAGMNFGKLHDLQIPIDAMGTTRLLQGGIVSSPNVQLRIGWRIGD